MKNLLHLFYIFTLILQLGCSHFEPQRRVPANQTSELSHYLGIDRFKYYLNEYSVAMEGKIPDEIIRYLRTLNIETIIALNLPESSLQDVMKYDSLIYTLLAENNLLFGKSQAELTWNYNFFKKKLNEAFILGQSKLQLNPVIQHGLISGASEFPVEKMLYEADEMTLDSGHYIANRTTRAIFWEANHNGRSVEFHLGDSREFLKNLNQQNGKILFEVKPLARNYNKIYIVQYPGETSFRYAITNIGGHDRLNHLTHQFSLSTFSDHKLDNHIVVKGNVDQFHEARNLEHQAQLRLLPHADRVIIGQKESIDGKFYLFWKVKALKNIYDSDPSLYKKADPKLLTQFEKLTNGNFEQLFKDKKIIEDLYTHFESHFKAHPELIPPQFKIFNYDNFTIEMSDYVFTNHEGQTMRWRIISNVWGDEIVPIAKALKATGHHNVTYIGTAGAFHNNDIKVGDLVIPNAVYTQDEKMTFKANWINIAGAKKGGTVEHVGSPFEESKEWLEKVRERSQFVEVETSYLAQIFNEEQDNVEMYLLISDILGSDTETLAHATSAKRKNMQNKLLAELFFRDTKKIPLSRQVPSPSLLKLKIDQLFANKSVTYRYYLHSLFQNESQITDELLMARSSKLETFTDQFLVDRLIAAGEMITYFKEHQPYAFDLAFPESLLTGSFNPKERPFNFVLVPHDPSTLNLMRQTLNELAQKNPKAFKLSSPVIENELTSEVYSHFYRANIPKEIDPDFILKIYTFAGLKNAGLYSSVTYNGNITFDFLPTIKAEDPTIHFTPINKGSNQSCEGLIDAFMKTLF